jgi:sRNA-binding regulator protein Hfq
MSYLEIVVRLTIEQKVSSKIFLVNGIKLEGRVLGIDDTSILFQKGPAPAFVVSRAAVASFLPDSEVAEGLIPF